MLWARGTWHAGAWPRSPGGSKHNQVQRERCEEPGPARDRPAQRREDSRERTVWPAERGRVWLGQRSPVWVRKDRSGARGTEAVGTLVQERG